MGYRVRELGVCVNEQVEGAHCYLSDKTLCWLRSGISFVTLARILGVQKSGLASEKSEL